MASIARPLFRAAQPLRQTIQWSSRAARTGQAPAGPSRILPLVQQQRFKSTSTTSSPSTSEGSASTVKPEQAGAARTAAEQADQAEQAEGSNPAIEAPVPGSKPQPLGKIEPRLSMTFTCTADGCGHRSTHEFAKRSYQKGIVLVQCPSCKNRHLIADHIGWFKESTESGKLKTVEDLLRAKGEKIKKGRINMDGDIEYDPESQ